MWRTTNLIECGHRGLQDYRLTRYFYVFTFLINFFKIQKRDILRFCRVSYVLSNSEHDYDTTPFKVNWRLCAVQLTFDYTGDNGEKVKENVSADVKDNYVRYHMKDDDSEVSVIEDFNRVRI